MPELSFFSGYQMFVCLKSILPVGMLLIVVMRCVYPSSCADVSWSVLSDPALFYSTVYLGCEITNDYNNCTKSLKQWLGGRNYGSLCYGTDCRGSNKYEIMDSNCSYVLVINRFSVDDINCEYTCSYGIFNMRKNLTEQVGRFRYYPQRHDVNKRSYSQGKNVVLYVDLARVFPNPQNYLVSMNGRNVSDEHIHRKSTRSSFFYEVELMMKLPDNPCKGEVTIDCSWDSTDTTNIAYINYNICKDKYYSEGEKKSSNTGGIIGGVVAVVVLIISAIISFYLCKKRRMSQSSRYTVPAEQCTNRSEEENCQ